MTIVASDYVFSVAVSALLRCAEAEAPGLRFDIRPIWGYLAQKLDHGDVDVVVSSATALSRAHPSEPLFSDTFSCVAWTGNTEIGPTLDLETFKRLGHACTVLGGGLVTTLDQATLLSLGIQRRVEVSVPSFTMLPACIVGTRRIAMLHTALASQLAKTWPLRVMVCPVEIPPLVIATQWHRYQTDDPAIGWVRATLRRIVLEGGLASTEMRAPAERARRQAAAFNSPQ